MAQWLVNLGAEVTGFANEVPTNPSHFEVLGLPKLINDVRGEISDSEALNRAFIASAPDIVFHFAAQPIVSRSIQNPVENYMTNVMGTVQVMEALRKSKGTKAAVIITSDKCYENVEWEFGYREIDKLGGKDPYSASKACAEIIFHSYFKTYFKDVGTIKLASARAGNVIGGGDWALDRIIPDNVRAWGAGKIPVIRSPKSTRPWQHVLEPLSGYLWLGAGLLKGVDGLNGESFNFGPAASTNATVEDLLKEMTRYWPNKTWKVEESQLARKEAGLLKLCCDKALARLGWNSTMTFEETVSFTAEWYKAFYETSSAAASELTNAQIKKYETLARSRGIVWAS